MPIASYHPHTDRPIGGTINDNEPSLFASLWRFKWYIVAAGILAAVAGYGLSMLQDELYQSEGQLLLNDPGSSGGVASEIGIVLDPGRYVRNQAEIIQSPQVAAQASELLGGDPSTSAIQDSMSVSTDYDIDAIWLRSTQSTGELATAVVNAVAAAYEDVVEEGISTRVNSAIATLEQSKLDLITRIAEIDAELAADPGNITLTAQRTAAVSQLVALDTRIEELGTDATIYGSGVQLYVAPGGPGSQIQPRPVRNAAIALVLGVIAAGAWAWWRSEKDQRADDRNTPAAILDAPLLAVVPEYSDVGANGPNPADANPESGAAEAYHFAVSALSFALDQVGGKTVIITSTAPGDGKSVTALNIAFAAAKDGRRPLLIDADERARGLTRLSGLGIGLGLTDLTNGRPTEDVIGEWLMMNNTSLPFVPAGSRLDDSAAAYFRSTSFRNALATTHCGLRHGDHRHAPRDVRRRDQRHRIASGRRGSGRERRHTLARPPRRPPAPLHLTHPDPRLHLQPRQGLHRRLRLRLRLRPRQDLAGARGQPRTPTHSSSSGGGGSAAGR